jgi:alpha-1,3-mannosyltransferase
MGAYSFILDILSNPKHSLWIAPLLVAADAVLCGLVIQKIPCKLSFKEHPSTFQTNN